MYTRDTIDQFVTDQVKKWDRRGKNYIPVVAVSSEPGSGGHIVAQMLAKASDFSFFQHEIIRGIAESADISEKVIETLEKERLSGVQDFIASLINDRYLWPGLYLEHLMKIVGVIGKHGRSVIVGRGVNFILPPHECVSVRIVAPQELRIQNVARTFAVPLEAAKRRVLIRESKRRAFVRQSFNADIADPMHYDLIVNIGKISLASAVEAIKGALSKI